MSELLFEKIQDKDITFERLHKLTNKRLIINAYNVTSSKQEIFSHLTSPSMSCIKALQLSISIPLIFETFPWNGSIYIDGGMIDNFPLRASLKYEDPHILAITTLFGYYHLTLYEDDRLNVVLINDKLSLIHI